MTAEFITSILMWSSDVLLINKPSVRNRGSKIILHQRIINNSDITYKLINAAILCAVEKTENLLSKAQILVSLKTHDFLEHILLILEKTLKSSLPTSSTRMFSLCSLGISWITPI